MRSGKLDKVIRIDSFGSSAVDDYGTSAATWSALATVRAQVIQSSSEEFLRGSGASEENTIIFRIRYLDGITTADRIHYNGQYFNIKEITEIGRRKGLDLRALGKGET